MTDCFDCFPVAELSVGPTEVVRLSRLGSALGHPQLFMKQDNLSGSLYGGNKIRKLEFLLGDALANGCRSVITYGAAGSNHALATAICSRQLGLCAHLILAPQEPSDHVRNNLRMGHAVGAAFHLCAHYNEFSAATDEVAARCAARDGVAPYIIPAGGTNAIGALGFIRAALELSKQMRPDVIYLPMGTGGTYAGLLVGFLMAGLRPRIEAVRVVESAFRDESHICALCDELCSTLGLSQRVASEHIRIRNEFFGEGYGVPTPAGRRAVARFQALEHIALEQTYTGKTLAALESDARAGALQGQSVLYWNTLNSRDFSQAIAGVELRDLPPECSVYWDASA